MADQGTLRRGIIKSLKGSNAIVATPKRGTCDNCSEKALCFAIGSDEPDMILAINNVKANEGDFVEISVPDGTFLAAAFFVYLFPVLGMLTGALLGSSYLTSYGFDSDLAAIIGTFIGLAISFAISMTVDRSLKKNPKFSPVVSNILRESNTNDIANICIPAK